MRKAARACLSPPRRPPLIGESCSALCASSLEDVSAVGSLHSFTEAVLLFALTLLRLISSKHYMHLLKRDRKFYFTRCLTDRIIIAQTSAFVKSFVLFLLILNGFVCILPLRQRKRYILYYKITEIAVANAHLRRPLAKSKGQ